MKFIIICATHREYKVRFVHIDSEVMITEYKCEEKEIELLTKINKMVNMQRVLGGLFRIIHMYADVK